MSAPAQVGALGIVLGYRRGSNRQYVNQVYIKIVTPVDNVHSLVGRKVKVADAHGNAYLGKVVGVHGTGRNAVVIATFNRNLPGQLIGSEAIIS